MADRTTVEVFGLNSIVRKMLRMEKAVESKILMGQIGEFIKFKIKSRTQEGKDVEGQPFKPYAESYAAYRAKHGHSVDKVNLTFHGTMMSAIDYSAGKRSVHAYVLNTPDPYSKKHVTNAAKAFFLNKERQFFALSDKEVETIKDMVQDYIYIASKS